MQQEPLNMGGDDVSNQGFLQPFDSGMYEDSFKRGVTYVAGCNMLWASLLGSITPAVPIIGPKVEALASQLFANPDAAAPMLHIAATPLPLQKGSLVRLSPDEICHAFIMQVAEKIRSQTPEDVLKQYRRMLLSWPTQFIHKDSDDDRYYYATNQRELFKGITRAVAHSTCQPVWDSVPSSKSRVSRLS